MGVFWPYRYWPGDQKRDYPAEANVVKNVDYNNGTQTGTFETIALPLEVINITTGIEVIEL